MSEPLFNLPTMDEVAASRKGPITKGESRLQKAVKEQKDERKEEARWKKEVWKRDSGTCRWCRRHCEKRLDLVPLRGEVHHVSGRVVRTIRWDRRNGLLLCASCHERLTGKVAEKHVIESRHTFTVEGVSYLNADKPLKFKRIV